MKFQLYKNKTLGTTSFFNTKTIDLLFLIKNQGKHKTS